MFEIKVISFNEDQFKLPVNQQLFDQYEPKLYSPDKFQYRYPIPNFSEIHSVISDMRQMNMTSPIMCYFPTLHVIHPLNVTVLIIIISVFEL